MFADQANELFLFPPGDLDGLVVAQDSRPPFAAEIFLYVEKVDDVRKSDELKTGAYVVQVVDAFGTGKSFSEKLLIMP